MDIVYLTFNNDFADKIIRLTKNVTFTQKMDSHLDKLSYEYQALAILKLIFDKKANGFIKSESPDLQNNKTNVGIEVINSFPQSYFRVKKLENQLWTELASGNLEKANKTKKIIEDLGLEILGDKYVSYPDSTALERNTFYKSVYSKSQKIKYYKANGFDKIGLFVWHLSPVATDFVEDLPNDWSDLLKSGDFLLKQKFDFIIVIVEHTLLFYNENYDCKHIIKIPYNVFCELPTLGRMAAEGMIPDDDPIWS